MTFPHFSGHQRLQAPVLVLQGLQASRLGHFQATVLRAPLIERDIRDSMFAAEVLDLDPGIGLFQDSNDLLFGVARLLHERLLSLTERKSEVYSGRDLGGKVTESVDRNEYQSLFYNFGSFRGSL